MLGDDVVVVVVVFGGGIKKLNGEEGGGISAVECSYVLSPFFLSDTLSQG